MSKFQIITLAIFVICIIGGVIAFATFKGNSGSSTLPPITIWGTFPAATFDDYIAQLNNNLPNQVSIKYVQENPDTFPTDFVNALATGQGPDAILVPADMLLPEVNKLTLIPYTALDQRNFINFYIQEAGVYLSQNGILAIPFTVDPLVMYWNRDTFNAEGIAKYPNYWDEFTGTSQKPGLVQKLTTLDQNGNIRKSAVAMGDFGTMSNAREVLGSLLLQLGNRVTMTNTDGSTVSALNVSPETSSIPAFDFFDQFINPSSPNYSWNAGMSNDKSAFLGGSLATYFGYASEIADLRAKNPNLNFDVAPLPQIRPAGGVSKSAFSAQTSQKAVYARMYGFSLVRASANTNAAYQIISTITSPQYLTTLAQTMYLPTVRTDIIAEGSTDPYISIFNQQALVARDWLDVSPVQSRKLFSSIVQSITSGQKTTDQAVRDGSDQYDVVLKAAGK